MRPALSATAAVVGVVPSLASALRLTQRAQGGRNNDENRSDSGSHDKARPIVVRPRESVGSSYKRVKADGGGPSLFSPGTTTTASASASYEQSVAAAESILSAPKPINTQSEVSTATTTTATAAAVGPPQVNRLSHAATQRALRDVARAVSGKAVGRYGASPPQSGRAAGRFDLSNFFEARHPKSKTAGRPLKPAVPAGKPRTLPQQASPTPVAFPSSSSLSSPPPQLPVAAPSHRPSLVASLHQTAVAVEGEDQQQHRTVGSMPAPQQQQQSTVSSSPSPSPSSSSSPSSSTVVPPTFIARLAATVWAKRLRWSAVLAARPELSLLPIMNEREHWMENYCRLGSASPLPLPSSSPSSTVSSPPPAVLMCAADTGTGKSVLIPLYLLDAHWATLEEQLTAGGNTNGDGGSGDGSVGRFSSSSSTSLPAFVDRFKRCSRVCILVSQPTRVACIEMAKYTAAVLAASGSTDDERNGQQHHRQHQQQQQQQLLGKRIGYAVGGEVCFCAETEIIYATPGYILNTLVHHHRRSSASGRAVARPTTLVIDEAHCRELETDLLLAWVRTTQLSGPPADGATATTTNGAVAQQHEQAFPLRQVVVMSATMNVLAMLRYLRGSSDGAGGGGDARVPSHSSSPGVHVMSFASQRRLLETLLAPQQPPPPQQQLSPSSPPVMVAGVDVLLALLQQEQQQTRLYTTSRANRDQSSSSPLSSSSIGSPFAVDEYFIADLGGSGAHHINSSSGGGSGFTESDIMFGPWKGTAAAEEHRNYRAQRHHQRTYRGSNNGGGTRRGGGSGSGGTGRGGSSALPLLLSSEGQRVFGSLQHFYSMHGLRHGGTFHFQQAVVVAQFALQLLQTVRLRWVAGNTNSGGSITPSNDSHPATVLFFLPGFGEIQLLLQCLEKVCSRPTALLPSSSSLSNASIPPSSSPLSPGVLVGGEPLIVLQSGEEVFSVPLLHSAAVGSPQEHLDASTACGAPLRLVLATAVAESSLTIPNVRVVVDSALQRDFRADPLTGTMRKTTALGTAGSLRQRSGRAGRTCEGVVIHLAPRELFAPPPSPLLSLLPHSPSPSAAAAATTGPVSSTASVLSPALVAAIIRAEESRTTNSSSGSGGRSQWEGGAGATAATAPQDVLSQAHFTEPLRESPSTTLLRVKALFGGSNNNTTKRINGSGGRSASQVLAAMPVPPNAAALETAYRLLIDMDLLIPGTGNNSNNSNKSSSSNGDGCESVALALYGDALCMHLDTSRLSGKGRVVAALPIPPEQALLVFHSLQFACVEDAVIMACAMTVPSLTLAPRISHFRADSDPNTTTGGGEDGGGGGGGGRDAAAFSPLEQHYRHLWVQRELAGFLVPTTNGDELHGRPLVTTKDKSNDNHGMEGSPQPPPLPPSAEGGSLSEPLVLRALMQRWYTCSTQDEVHRFTGHFGVNRSALRSVDVSVAQCCQRIIQLLSREEAEEERERTQQQQQQHQPGADDGGAPSLASNEEDSPDYYSFHHLMRPKQERADQTQQRQRSSLSLLSPVYPPSSSPSSSARLIDPTWPPAYRRRLVRSLQRLRLAALSRAAQRQGPASRGAPLHQWFSSDGEVARLFGDHYTSQDLYLTSGGGGGDGRKAGRGDTQTTATAMVLGGEPAGHPVVEMMVREEMRRQVTEVALIRRSSKGSSNSNSVGVASHRQCVRKVVLQLLPTSDGGPAVGFALGSIADRLCAAFIAAFARQTLRGENGGHRRHHRRLIRNWAAIGDDAAHTCTFQVNCSEPPTSAALLRTSGGGGGGGGVRPPPSEAALTSAVVQRALSPFLRGAGLRQLELFSTGRTAAVRFASLGFRGNTPPSFPANTTAAVAGGGNQDEHRDASGMDSVENSTAGQLDSEDARLQPRVVRYERGLVSDTTAIDNGDNNSTSRAVAAWERSLFGNRGNPLVTLAPFGVSLLIAAQGALQRITVMAPPPPMAALDDLQQQQGSGRPAVTIQLGAHSPSPQPERTHIPTPTHAAGNKEPKKESDDSATVVWNERAGLPRRLARGDVEALGLGHLFPTVAAATPKLPVVPAGNAAGSASAGTTASTATAPFHSNATTTTTTISGSGPASPVTADESRSLLLSVVPPVNVTGGVYWRVALPSLAALWSEKHLNATVAAVGPSSLSSSPSTADNEEATTSNNSSSKRMLFCDVCQCLLIGAAAVEGHCRSPSHLSHLLFSVKHGVTGGDWRRLRGERATTTTTREPQTNRHYEAEEASPPADARHRSSTTSNSSSSSAIKAIASLALLHGSTTTSPGDGHAPSPPPLLGMEVHSCRVSSLSFLNALQWHQDDASAGHGDGRAPPLAIAGGLIAAASGGAGGAVDLTLHRHGQPLNTNNMKNSNNVNRNHRDAASPFDPTASMDAVFTARYGSAAAALGHKRGSRGHHNQHRQQQQMHLTAHHVWVLNLAAPPDGGPSPSQLSTTTTTPSLSSALFVLAGYVSGSSRQYPTALLFNGSHTHVHGIMLHDCGVWRLPRPVPVAGALAVLERVRQGWGWPGVFIPPVNKSDSDGTVDGAAAAVAMYDGLHWCSACVECPENTFDAVAADCMDYPDSSTSSDNNTSMARGGQQSPRSIANATASSVVAEDAANATTVAATILLTLHEYLSAQRNMVTLPDYCERLIAKLDRLPPLASGSSAASIDNSSSHSSASAPGGEWGNIGVQRLCRFLTGRTSIGGGMTTATAAAAAPQGQSLPDVLRDLGCQFAAPPVAVLGLLAGSTHHDDNRDEKDDDDDVEGEVSAVVEMRFTVPSALPSFLPVAGFGHMLRAEAERAKGGRGGTAAGGGGGAVRSSAAGGGGGSAVRATPVKF